MTIFQHFSDTNPVISDSNYHYHGEVFRTVPRLMVSGQLCRLYTTDVIGIVIRLIPVSSTPVSSTPVSSTSLNCVFHGVLVL